jgi:hypothetical protein
MVAFAPRDPLARELRLLAALHRADVPGEEEDLRQIAGWIERSLESADPEGGDLSLEALHLAACLHGLGRIDQAWDLLENQDMPMAWFLAATCLIEHSVLCPQIWRMVQCGLLESREDPGGASNTWRLRLSPLYEENQGLHELAVLAWSRRFAKWLSPLATSSQGDLRVEVAGLHKPVRSNWTQCLREAFSLEGRQQGWRVEPHVFAG